jgi:aspartyl/asparaginyl-tRNA synthetase
MRKKIILAILIVLAIMIGVELWRYLRQARYPQIEKILSHPKAYEGKVVTIEGEVTDRTSLFIVVKFFKLRDKTGEIIVVTKKPLPEIRSNVHVTGKIDEAFSIGDQRFLVFVEES